MSHLQIGQRVITANGEGIVDTITAGAIDSDDILRYRVTSTHSTRRRWHYLDEIIPLDHESASQ